MRPSRHQEGLVGGTGQVCPLSVCGHRVLAAGGRALWCGSLQGLRRHPAGSYVLLALRTHPLTERRGNPTPHPDRKKYRVLGDRLDPSCNCGFVDLREPAPAHCKSIGAPGRWGWVWTHGGRSVGLGGPAWRLGGLSRGFAWLRMQLITWSPPLYLVAKAIRGLGSSFRYSQACAFSCVGYK